MADLSEALPNVSQGDKMRIKGERGTRYTVIGYSTDGSVKLYGGSTNPNGWRGVKSVHADQLIPVKGG